jgi:VWFA-related protein
MYRIQKKERSISNLQRRLTACGLTALLVSLPCVGQSAPDAATTIAVDVNFVTLPVTVRDKHGQIVRSLTKDDFVLHDDGQLQTIRYFSQDSNLPLTLGLLVDTSMSQRNVLDQERNASRTFLDEMLAKDKDKAFVLHFDREVELLQDLTSSRSQLQSALDLLQSPKRSDEDRSRDRGDSTDPGSQRHHHEGGTLLYDAIYLASSELMQKQEGRKAVIVLSDGVDRGSKKSLESAIAAAQHADTVVYSILFADDHREQGFERSRGGGGGWPGGGGGYPGGGYPGGGRRGGRGGGQRPSQESHADGKKILERISKETGGRLYTVSKKETVGDIYDSIAEELRTQYSLGYTPAKDSASAGYHRITLESKNKDLSIQTRDGYFADH